MTLKLGTSLSSSYPHAPDERAGAQWMIERAAAAAAAGLDSLTVGDHHATPSPYYQNTPMLGRLLAEWDERPAGCLFLLPLWHPVLVAEQVGTLASIHPGPFIVQTAVGHGQAQFEAMSSSLKRRGRDLEESILFIRALLAGETVSSERFGVVDASISPVAPDGVEWWIGAFADAGIDRAARLGDVFYAGPSLTPEQAQQQVDLFQKACAVNGREPRQTIRRDVFVAATAADAQRVREETVSAGYRGFDPTALTFGDIEAVAEQLEPYGAMGYDEIVVRHVGVAQADVLESFARLGEVRRLLR